MSYALFVGTISFLIAMVWGPLLIRWLRAQKLGKRIRDEGPESHQAKSGTPTSKTDPYSPAVASKLIDLAMAMRWRAVSAAADAADAENTRAAIDEVFSRIDAAAA